MKSPWKKAFLWSSLGSIAIGTIVAFAKRTRSPQGPALEYRAIPADCQTISLWTEQFKIDDGASDLAVQDKYVLRVTPFKVWSVLEADGERVLGAVIYHVTHVRYAETAGGEGYPDEGKLQDRFYGVVSSQISGESGSRRNQIARGGILEFRKCLVGGAANGVETGEVHRSLAPILNYRFEYISA
jgi:hypothetical protein